MKNETDTETKMLFSIFPEVFVILAIFHYKNNYLNESTFIAFLEPT